VSRRTVEDILAWDDGTDRRHELVDGDVPGKSSRSAVHSAQHRLDRIRVQGDRAAALTGAS
jgi:hypothetical protein